MPRTRIAAMIIQDSKLLMLKGKGFEELWTAGGKIEEGETEEECLRRELKEEISVDLISAKFFKEYTGPSYFNPDHIITQKVYVADVAGIPIPANEIEECIWLTREDFEKRRYVMVTSAEKEIIPDLIQAGVW